MSYKPNPVLPIVAAFGSQIAMARALGLNQTTVFGWVQRARVPSKRIPEVIDAAAKLRPPVRLEPNDFFAIKDEAA